MAMRRRAGFEHRVEESGMGLYLSTSCMEWLGHEIWKRSDDFSRKSWRISRSSESGRHSKGEGRY